MRAAGAEVGHALQLVAGITGLCRDLLHPLLGVELFDPFLHIRVAVERFQTRGDETGNLGGAEFAMAREQPVALLVELADDARAHILAPVVELFLQLVLDDSALLLDHDDLFQAFGEVAGALRLQRPGHADLVEADTDLGGPFLVDAQVIQRLHHVQIGLAGGDDADAWLRTVDHRLVDTVGAGEGEGGIDLVAVQAVFLLIPVIGPADRQATRRQLEIRHLDVHALRVDIDTRCTFNGFGDTLEPDCEAGIATHGPAQQAEIQVFLHVRRMQHRDHGGHEDMFRLVQKGG